MLRQSGVPKRDLSGKDEDSEPQTNYDFAYDRDRQTDRRRLSLLDNKGKLDLWYYSAVASDVQYKVLGIGYRVQVFYFFFHLATLTYSILKVMGCR